MKFIYSLICLLFFTLQSVAQLNHFIYIEAEGSRPFYVKMNEKVYSSSLSAFVIIPKLTSGTYKLDIGFPKGERLSQKFEIDLRTDAGFILKNFNEGGWGLFNMNTMSVVMSSGGGKVTGNIEGNALALKDDSFLNLLADAVKAPRNPRQPDSVKSALNTPVTKSQDTLTTSKPAGGKLIEQLLTRIDATGRSMVYIDNADIQHDTITIFIPYTGAEKEKQDNQRLDSGRNPANRPSGKQQQPADDVDSMKGNNFSKDKKAGNPNSYSVISLDPRCKAYATDANFITLRKKMETAVDDRNMIASARKYFKTKCFTTEQVKNLAILFLTDEGKFSFYESAYAHISDPKNVKNLQSLLSDEAYIDRFKALIR